MTPSPKPYSDDGPPLALLKNVTAAHLRYSNLARRVARLVLNGKEISVIWGDDRGWPFLATYGPSGILTLNAGRLTEAFLENREGMLDLLIHEFGHEFEGDHLSENYYRALTKIGARLALAVAQDPEVLRLDADELLSVIPTQIL